jgi:hypothetical protein
MPRSKFKEEVKDLYNENYKSLKKEINEDNKSTSHVWVGRINTIKKSILQKQFTCSMQSLSKFQGHSSQERKVNPKVHMEEQKTPNSQSSPKQKE